MSATSFSVDDAVDAVLADLAESHAELMASFSGESNSNSFQRQDSPSSLSPSGPSTINPNGNSLKSPGMLSNSSDETLPVHTTWSPTYVDDGTGGLRTTPQRAGSEKPSVSLTINSPNHSLSHREQQEDVPPTPPPPPSSLPVNTPTLGQISTTAAGKPSWTLQTTPNGVYSPGPASPGPRARRTWGESGGEADSRMDLFPDSTPGPSHPLSTSLRRASASPSPATPRKSSPIDPPSIKTTDAGVSPLLRRAVTPDRLMRVEAQKLEFGQGDLMEELAVLNGKLRRAGLPGLPVHPVEGVVGWGSREGAAVIVGAVEKMLEAYDNRGGRIASILNSHSTAGFPSAQHPGIHAELREQMSDARTQLSNLAKDLSTARTARDEALAAARAAEQQERAEKRRAEDAARQARAAMSAASKASTEAVRAQRALSKWQADAEVKKSRAESVFKAAVGRAPRDRSSGDSTLSAVIEVYEGARSQADAEISSLREALKRADKAATDANEAVRFPGKALPTAPVSPTSASTINLTLAPESHSRGANGQQGSVVDLNGDVSDVHDSETVESLKQALRIALKESGELKSDTAALREALRKARQRTAEAAAGAAAAVMDAAAISERPTSSQWAALKAENAELRRQVADVQEQLEKALFSPSPPQHPDQSVGADLVPSVVSSRSATDSARVARAAKTSGAERVIDSLSRSSARAFLTEMCVALGSSHPDDALDALTRVGAERTALQALRVFLAEVNETLLDAPGSSALSPSATTDELISVLRRLVQVDLKAASVNQSMIDEAQALLSSRITSVSAVKSGKESDLLGAVRELIEVEKQLFALRGALGAAGAEVAGAPPSAVIHRAVSHFQSLFDVSEFEGVIPRMNWLYSKTAEEDTAKRVLAGILGHPPSSSMTVLSNAAQALANELKETKKSAGLLKAAGSGHQDSIRVLCDLLGAETPTGALGAVRALLDSQARLEVELPELALIVSQCMSLLGVEDATRVVPALLEALGGDVGQEDA